MKRAEKSCPTQYRLAEPVDIWPHTFLFFGDERFVPADDTRSNYPMVRQSLSARCTDRGGPRFSPYPRLAGPHQAADSYAPYVEDVLRRVAWPEFDLVLLGWATTGTWPRSSLVRTAGHDRWVTFSPPGRCRRRSIG